MTDIEIFESKKSGGFKVVAVDKEANRYIILKDSLKYHEALKLQEDVIVLLETK